MTHRFMRCLPQAGKIEEMRERESITKSKTKHVLWETFYSKFSPLRALSRPAWSAWLMCTKLIYIHMFSIFCVMAKCVLPWYNCNGWLGVKTSTYLPFWGGLLLCCGLVHWQFVFTSLSLSVCLTQVSVMNTICSSTTQHSVSVLFSLVPTDWALKHEILMKAGQKFCASPGALEPVAIFCFAWQ